MRRGYLTLVEAQAAGQENGSSLTNAPVDELLHPVEPIVNISNLCLNTTFLEMKWTRVPALSATRQAGS